MLTVEQMKIRKQNLGYSYEMLAEKSGVPLSTIQKIFGGITASPRYRTLEALDRVLGIWAEDNPDYAPEHHAAADYAPEHHAAADCAPEKSMPADPAVEKHGTAEFAAEKAIAYRTVRHAWWPEETFLRSFLPPKEQGEYTSEDLALLPENLRAELIDGVIFSMAAPGLSHQLLAGEIYRQISNYMIDRGGPCEALIAPFDVHIGNCEDFEDKKNVLQPDVLVCCSREKLSNGKYLSGAPDLVVEVLSPSTAIKDQTLKAGKYMACDVRELWFVDPKKNTVQVLLLAEEKMETYSFQQKIPVGIYNGDLKIDLRRIAEKLKNSD